MVKQNLKIGDKLLCKNTYGLYCFMEGEEYVVCAEIIVGVNEYSYSVQGGDSSIFTTYFAGNLYNFFYTKQELRKIKLNRIENEKSKS